MQRTPEWHAMRLNKLTASNLGAAMGQVAYVSRMTAYRRAVGTDSFEGNVATRWGVAHEEEAIAAYTAYTGKTVQQTGLHQHPTIAWLAGSPDGLIGDDGLLEVKCPYYQLSKGPHKEVPNGYYLQMQQLLQCCDRVWCDYVCYCGHKGMSIFRVTRDDSLFEDLMGDMTTFATGMLTRKGPGRQPPGRKRAIAMRVKKSMGAHCTCTCALAPTI